MENYKNREIWVFIETDGGKALKSSLELFSPAVDISGKTGGSVTAVIFGDGIAAEAETLGAYGAKRVIAVELPSYSASAYTEVMYKLVCKYSPDTVMLSATSNGKDFASRLACRLKTGITANCTALDSDADSGLISWMMPAPGGVMATILCEKTRPQMGTVCPGIFKKPKPKPEHKAPVIFETPEYSVDKRVQLVSSIRDAADGIVNIEDAEIIVAGGRGMGGPEGFGLIQKLAAVLGASVGASRAAVDAEWAPQSSLVGQTGKVVHPKLYIACGISGALQHLVGVGADCIVAINSDPEAPIFDVSDYGIVGSVESVIPALIAEIETLKA